MINRFLWIVFLTAGLPAARAFSLAGPVPGFVSQDGTALPASFGDAWQTAEITYNPLTEWDTGDIGPKNWGEGYRRNTPVMYYACDGPFITFFGDHGTQAIDQAFDILNNAFTNNPTGVTNGLDGYSPSLSEFPLDSQNINWTARGAGLLDLKSTTLHLMMEQLGLANPVRYTWTLHRRYLPPGGPTCEAGDEEYLVVQRNFDTFTQSPSQTPYSAYVNNTLYSYIIAEYCDAQHSPFGPSQSVLADAVEYPVDPLADVFSPVAAGDGGWVVDPTDTNTFSAFRPPLFTSNALFPFGFGLAAGGFYTGLTRDDVAGLRYLMRADNLVWESAAAGSLLTSSTAGGGSGLGSPYLLYTSNLTAFATIAQTNGPAVLNALFPGLVITSSSNYFTVLYTTNIVAHYNPPGVFGNPPQLVLVTNVTATGITNYVYTFANLVITNSFLTNSHYYHTNTKAQLVTIKTSQPGVAGNPLETTTNIQYISLSVPSGDYYIDPNYSCGPSTNVSSQYQGFPITNVVATTNLIFTASDPQSGYFISQSLVTYSTSHVFVVQSPICASVTTGGVFNATGLYGGIEKIHFVSTRFDSLLGQSYQPRTNTYTMTFINASNQPVTQTFVRVVTTPDVLLTVADFAAPNAPALEVSVPSTLRTDPNFNVHNIPNRLAGPGTIDPITTFTFNKVGAVFGFGPAGSTNAFLNQAELISMLAWGSFDNTTNAPVVYPNTDFANLEDQILAQLTASPSGLPLPNGTNGLVYPTTTFIAAGAAMVPLIQPLSWSATGLPSGMGVSTDGVLSGTPTDNAGTYDFTLKVVDYNSRSIHWSLSITINEFTW